MKENFTRSLGLVLLHEGGYVNDPRDPGGATNKGITQEVYDHWRQKENLPIRSVRHINNLEVGRIYRKNYWDKIAGDELPMGIDYCVFDFAVNSGVSRTSTFLQKAALTVEDGQIGPKTIAAVRGRPYVYVIDKICNLRLEFLQRLPTWKTFGHGWGTRVKEVREEAKSMVGGKL